jgi:hypothetical protein
MGPVRQPGRRGRLVRQGRAGARQALELAEIDTDAIGKTAVGAGPGVETVQLLESRAQGAVRRVDSDVEASNLGSQRLP